MKESYLAHPQPPTHEKKEISSSGQSHALIALLKSFKSFERMKGLISQKILNLASCWTQEVEGLYNEVCLSVI